MLKSIFSSKTNKTKETNLNVFLVYTFHEFSPYSSQMYGNSRQGGCGLCQRFYNGEIAMGNSLWISHHEHSWPGGEGLAKGPRVCPVRLEAFHSGPEYKDIIPWNVRKLPTNRQVLL